jgi:hypothetical protein
MTLENPELHKMDLVPGLNILRGDIFVHVDAVGKCFDFRKIIKSFAFYHIAIGNQKTGKSSGFNEREEPEKRVEKFFGDVLHKPKISFF